MRANTGYGPVTNEELPGEAVAPTRDKLVIASKFGFDIHADDSRGAGTSSRPEHIHALAEVALKRLRTDRTDLFYQHRADPGVGRGACPVPVRAICEGARQSILRFHDAGAGLRKRRPCLRRSSGRSRDRREGPLACGEGARGTCGDHTLPAISSLGCRRGYSSSRPPPITRPVTSSMTTQ